MVLIAKFRDKDGYDYERTSASEILDDREYEVESVDIGGWSSTLRLKGIQKDFNAVMFDCFLDGKEYDVIKDENKLDIIEHSYRKMFKVK